MTGQPLTLEDFSQQRDPRFVAHVGPQVQVELTLERSTAHGDPRPFSLLFRGPLTPQLGQATYRIEHPGLGHDVDVFLVPVARREDGMRYEAVFG